jgi:hypothetical protein
MLVFHRSLTSMRGQFRAISLSTHVRGGAVRLLLCKAGSRQRASPAENMSADHVIILSHC